MISLDSSTHRHASIVEYPDRTSLLILRAANGRVLREVIYPSDTPESWVQAYHVLRREAAALGYTLQDDPPAPALHAAPNQIIGFPTYARGASDRD